VQKYLKLSDADLELNEKLKKEEIEGQNLAGGDFDTETDTGGGFGESVDIDYEKLSNMIVEKLSNKPILTEENQEKTEKVTKSKSKKKKSVKSQENEDTSKTDKEEE
jgi:hypothetical protein